MDLSPELELIHQPVRLKVMTLLYRHGDIGFTEAQKQLGLTPGNLDAHVRRLSEAGFAASRRALMRDHFEVRIRLLPAGRDAFDRYLAWLEAMLGQARV